MLNAGFVYWRTTQRLAGVAAISLLSLAACGCSLGPRSIEISRLNYNEAVKKTADQQLLLNIVRLRYVDTPSSLSISSIADQHELTAGLAAMPFFAPASAGDLGGYRGTILPQLNFGGATRPTMSYTPQDDQEFAKRLFTPITLEGITYLVKTTWPISSVFRLYLENLNWVSNAETGSGPTPRMAPDYARFRAGIAALQALQDQKLLAFTHRTDWEPASGTLPPEWTSATAAVEAAKSGLELRRDDQGQGQLVRKRDLPILRFDEAVEGTPEFEEFCRAFHLDSGERTFELTVDSLDPFLVDTPKGGLAKLDLETRSLLQVLFFLANGVDVPPELAANGVAPSTAGDDGRGFDWEEVLGGLFHVCSSSSAPASDCASVAVCYRGYWYYIDARDRDSKATFNLLMEVSRLEVGTQAGSGPMLTLPLGGR